MRRKYIVGAVPIALLIGAVLYLYGGGQAPSGQPPLQNLTAQNFGELKNEFNISKGEARVILLLSPT